jgi:hypothetical protein
MDVCLLCCVLSGRGLCDKLITRPEESYRMWCVVVRDLETSRMRRPWPALGRSATEKKKQTNKPSTLEILMSCYEIMSISLLRSVQTRTRGESRLLLLIPSKWCNLGSQNILRYPNTERGRIIIGCKPKGNQHPNTCIERNGLFGFDVRGSVRHSTVHTKKSNKMQQCIKICYSIFIRSSTCFGRHTAQHQEPKTALAASSFAYVQGCWTCNCWTLSASSNYTSNNPPRMQNRRLLVQF